MSHASCTLFSLLTVLSKLISKRTLKVVIDIPILQMKKLKLDIKYNNRPERTQFLSVGPEIQTQGSLAASLSMSCCTKPFEHVHCSLKTVEEERKRENCFKNTRKERPKKFFFHSCPACRWWWGARRVQFEAIKTWGRQALGSEHPGWQRTN